MTDQRPDLTGITTHNDQPVTAENLRYAATHEALCRSWIFDVLTGLADLLDPPPTDRGADPVSGSPSGSRVVPEDPRGHHETSGSPVPPLRSRGNHS